MKNGGIAYPNISEKKKINIFRYMFINKWLYIMLIPGILHYIVFRYFPMYGIIIAFKDFDIVKGIWDSNWVGFDNFKYLFQSVEFYKVFRNSIMLSLYRLVWGFPAPIILAIMLNEVRSLKFKKMVQTIIYIPHFISWVVIAGIIYNFLSPAGGAINHLLAYFGKDPIAFLQDPKYFRSIIVISDIWKEAGWGTIIYLAAITGIDTQLYEAAIIDGASRLKRIWHITIPGIMSTFVVLLVLRTGSLLSNGFEQIFLLYSPAVYDVGDVLETYTYTVGLLEGRHSFSTAVGLFQSLIGMILIFTTNFLSKKMGSSSLW